MGFVFGVFRKTRARKLAQQLYHDHPLVQNALTAPYSAQSVDRMNGRRTNQERHTGSVASRRAIVEDLSASTLPDRYFQGIYTAGSVHCLFVATFRETDFV